MCPPCPPAARTDTTPPFRGSVRRPPVRRGSLVDQLNLIPHRPVRFDGDAFGSSRPVRGRKRGGDTMCDRVAALLESRPGVWIDGREFAAIAGYAGWRTRISECRKPPYNLDIRNRQYRQGVYTVTEYMLVVS